MHLLRVGQGAAHVSDPARPDATRQGSGFAAVRCARASRSPGAFTTRTGQGEVTIKAARALYRAAFSREGLASAGNKARHAAKSVGMFSSGRASRRRERSSDT
jgi:hypothetical protein